MYLVYTFKFYQILPYLLTYFYKLTTVIAIFF